MEELCERTGLVVFNSIMGNDCNYIKDIPDDFVGLNVSTINSLSLDQYLERKELIEFTDKTASGWNGTFYINPYVMKNSLDDCYLYRWDDTARMCWLIRQYGLRTKLVSICALQVNEIGLPENNCLSEEINFDTIQEREITSCK